ncbi:MAG: Asp23/Gls24 family envelope stress response protein [Thermoleophilia bacterium]|nr:Asp23/Gls24 family envelope stress response protein [Thermoleophilia bacterium]
MSEYREHETATVSHAVVATYVADAARSVKEVVALHSSPWRSISPWARDQGSGAVVVKEGESGLLDVDIHVCLAWGSVIPEVATKVEQAVRERVRALLDMELGAVTLFVDEITDPAEAASS